MENEVARANLKRNERLARLCITGAIRTTPTTARAVLTALLGLLFLYLVVEGAGLKAAMKFKANKQLCSHFENFRHTILKMLTGR